MTGALSPSHWIVIAVVVLLLFGAKRLPDAARGVGRSLRVFKAETAALKDGAGPDGVSDAADDDVAARPVAAVPAHATAASPAPDAHAAR